MKHNGDLRKILVIDDDDELADVVRQVLLDAGYSVATVRHGAAALQARMRVEDFEQLDLAYTPPFATVWDPLLIAAQQLMKQL